MLVFGLFEHYNVNTVINTIMNKEEYTEEDTYNMLKFGCTGVDLINVLIENHIDYEEEQNEHTN